MKRTATKKNIEDFMTKNPNVKENINNVVNKYFLTDDLIIDCELPYENIIKDLVRNYELVSEDDILKYLMDKTVNKTCLCQIKIYKKYDYYISKLKDVCQEIYLDLCKDENAEIKLSDKIDINQDLANIIVKFVITHINNWSKNYNGVSPYSKVLDDNGTTILLGRFFKQFIFWDFGNIQFKKKYYSDEHFKPFNEMDFHCYGFNNNSDVLFTKQDHCFSHNTMKYDFEEGYIPDISQQCISTQAPIQQYTQQPVQKINAKNNNGCLGVIIVLISTIALCIYML